MSNQPYAYAVKKELSVPGVMAVTMEHRYEKHVGTVANFKVQTEIEPAEWHKILAFFKWTYDTTKSESQVRLFANTQTNIIKAWAFPQKANLGMHAQELEDHENFKPQRAQFPDPEWLYFGTVHHHCNGDAFQSGTDKNDEDTKDGIHITVGGLGGKDYNMHARLCVLKTYFEPDMSWFWDIGNAREQFSGRARKFMPSDDVLARMMMCEPAPEGTVFPEEWKANIITPPPAPPPRNIPLNPHWDSTTQNTWDNGYYQNRKEFLERSSFNYEIDLRRCLSDLGNYMKRQNEKHKGEKGYVPLTRDAIFRIFKQVNDMWDDDALNVIDILLRNDVRPENMEKFWRMDSAEKKKFEKLLNDTDKAVEELRRKKEAKEEKAKYNPQEDGPCPGCGLHDGRHSQICPVIDDIYSR